MEAGRHRPPPFVYHPFMPNTGRPSKYSPEIAEKAADYVRRMIKKQQVPYIEELALILNVNDDTLVEWAKEHDEFSATVKKLKTLQKLCLKRDALERKVHPTMAIFLLKANHGLSEKEPDRDNSPKSISVIFKGLHDADLDAASAIAAVDREKKGIPPA
jgi:hypothetical protein